MSAVVEREVYRGQHRQQAAGAVDDLEAWRFSSVPREQLQYASNVLQRESLLRIVCDICANGVVGGGVVFSRNGFQLEEYAQSFYSESWKKFVHVLLLRLWTYGFAGVVLRPHPEFKAVPRVLDLDLVDVKVYREVTGDCQYIFSERLDDRFPGAGSGGIFPASMRAQGTDTLEHRIPGVMVFEMDPPDRYGNLRSKVVAALEPRGFMQHLMRAECLAAAHMSSPPIIIKRVVNAATQNTREAIQVAAAADAHSVPRVAQVTDGNAIVETALRNLGYEVELMSAQDESVGMVDHRPAEVVANSGPHQVDPVNDPWGTQRAVYGAFASGAPMTQKVDLGPNRESAVHTPAREPVHLLQVMANYEERVAALWGVPRSFFAQFSAGHKSDNPDGRRMFDESQRALKQFLVPILNKVFDAIYATDLALDTVAETDELTLHDLHAKTKVTITLPGLPPVEELWALYMRGVLKYDALKMYLSQMYGIPVDDMEPKPKVSVKELNGIQPQPPAGGADAKNSAQTAADNKQQKSQERVKETTTETSKIDPKTGNSTKTIVKIKEGDNQTNITGQKRQATKVAESSSSAADDKRKQKKSKKS